MCKNKMAVNATDPNSARSSRTRPTQSPRARPSQSPRTAPRLPTSTATTASSSSDPSTSNTSSANYTTTSSSTFSSRTSLSTLRDSLSQKPHIYDISEIRAATNNFLAKRYSSSSSSSPSATACWRCTLRSSSTIVFQRKFRRKIEMSQLRERLSVLCRSHHSSVIKLLGASISGEHIYLVYEFIAGANLADCLRNSKNPNFTVLSTWISRMQVATDLAYGLDYIHNKTGLNISLVHNHIKSSSIIVTENFFNAKICHFGTAQLCGEVDDDENEISKKRSLISKGKREITEISEEEEDDDKTTSRRPSKELTRSGSGVMQFEGVRGYMSPEFQATGIATQKSDVYAFGVVILELLSGEEPFKYRYDKSRGDFIRTSVIDTARAAVDDGDEGKEGRLRRWVDRRLKDSFPVKVVMKLTRVALDCVHVDPDKRPDMGRVAGKISKWYLESKIWSDNLRISDQISVSLAPR